MLKTFNILITNNQQNTTLDYIYNYIKTPHFHTFREVVDTILAMSSIADY